MCCRKKCKLKFFSHSCVLPLIILFKAFFQKDIFIPVYIHWYFFCICVHLAVQFGCTTWPYNLAVQLGRTTWPYNLTVQLGRTTWPHNLAVELGRTTWPYNLAVQLGRTTWPYNLAVQLGRWTWPYNLAVKLVRRARLASCAYLYTTDIDFWGTFLFG